MKHVTQIFSRITLAATFDFSEPKIAREIAELGLKGRRMPRMANIEIRIVRKTPASKLNGAAPKATSIGWPWPRNGRRWPMTLAFGARLGNS
jgi:hypothetical protein